MKITKISFVFLLFLNTTAIAQVKTDTLTNAKIVQLTKIGLAPSIIINKIKSSVNLFDVSTNSLIDLSNSKVATDVINEMMRVSNVINENTQINSNDPNTMHKQGIYIYNANDTANQLKKIDAGIIAGYRSSGGSYYGFGGSTSMADLSGSESMMKINEKNPVFYFYFDNTSVNRGGDWFQASTPKEFMLVNLEVKKGNRSFRVGSSSSGYVTDNSKSGIPQKDQIPFDYVQISEGIYKITLKNSFKKGEYCFVLASNTNKVFDFGVQ